MSEYLADLHDRLRTVITETCNKVGCDKCDLKWDAGCSATELENKIWDEEKNDRPKT